MLSQPVPTHVSIGTRGFDLIGFDRLDSGAAPAPAFERRPSDGLHLYSSEAGARLFERMMDEFEDELFGPAL